MNAQVSAKAGVLIGGAMLALSGVATATPTLVGTTGTPTGINSLVIDGKTYEVTFTTTPAAPSPFTPGTQQGLDAANSLAAALTQLGVIGLQGASRYNGVSVGLEVMVDSVTSGGVISSGDEALYSGLPPSHWSGAYFSGVLGWGENVYCNPEVPTCDGNIVEAANFVGVSVTEPGTLVLLGVGLLGIGLSRRSFVR